MKMKNGLPDLEAWWRAIKDHPITAALSQESKMELDFHKLKNAVDSHFNMMKAYPLFRTAASGDELWETYLGNFPDGANPLYRERTTHDCSCCKHFMRQMGNVVAIIEGTMVSIWDITIDEPAYQHVAKMVAKAARSMDIVEPFVHHEWSVGTDHNFEDDDGRAKRWDHFHVELPKRNASPNYHVAKGNIPTYLGEMRTTYDVLKRSLTELTTDAFDTVIELIGQNSLYRGNEYKDGVHKLARLKMQYDLIKDPRQQDLFLWSRVMDTHRGILRLKSTAMGTLLVDLSNGVGLEEAVRSFEKIMAPENYKRPTALITPRMIEAARKEVEELGLTSALERRYATLADIKATDVLFANRAIRPKMKDAFDDLPTKAAALPKSLEKAETITIEDFIGAVVPKAESIEIMVENKHANNMVSLIAPLHRDAAPLFKWKNGFSWTYNGDVADSIKERVKKAGGNVTGDLCCRLSWSNYDDLDLHMFEPRTHIYFGHPRSTNGGMLDVDMNAGGGTTREPVENIFYRERRTMVKGVYSLRVHQFRKRETDNVGFEVEVDYLGKVRSFAYEKAVRQDEVIDVMTFRFDPAKDELEVISGLPHGTPVKTIWGIQTGDFRPVSVLMRSPNHWDGELGIGNAHYFFMLDGCVNDGQARGFYNEFLKSDLDKHRKVLELVGGKMKVESSADQLSGLGFSATKHTELLVRVKGSFTRVLKVLI